MEFNKLHWSFHVNPNHSYKWSRICNVLCTQNRALTPLRQPSGDSNNNPSSQTTTVTITHAAIASIAVSPQTISITNGCSVAYTATAFDSYGNSWGVSSVANWGITAAAGGLWTNNPVYISLHGKLGSHPFKPRRTRFSTITSILHNRLLPYRHSWLQRPCLLSSMLTSTTINLACLTQPAT